jgi:hypothetical protein
VLSPPASVADVKVIVAAAILEVADVTVASSATLIAAASTLLT